jgi:tripartite-type tricarboxylate transporter receptor subunit TctC
MAHLTSLRMLKDMGGKGTHVPYRGNAPALQGLLAGDVQFMFPSTFEAMPLMQANKVRVLATTADARLPSMANVPTLKELGFPELTPRIWYAFLLPAGARPEVVARVHDAFAKAVMDPAVQQQLRARGYIPEAKSVADTNAFIRAEYARWKKVAQENNITNLD